MAKKIKKYKVGIDSETYAISMVESPAIESDFVALSKEEEKRVFLESDERHMVYGAALIPDKDIYRNNGEQEFYISFTKESIEKMSQDFMKNYRQNEVTLDHEEMANDITITESWLVEDPYKDKANALGINVPKGTWMVGMKVNQIDVWERVKSGELKGFSVESMISLEDFSKQNTNNMTIETNDNMFWDKMKNILSEVFTSLSMSKKDEDIIKTMNENTNTIEELAAMSGFTSVEEYQKELAAIEAELEENAQPTEPTVETPKVEEPVVEEPKVEEPKPTEEEPKVEEKPQENNAHLEELINSLKEEINALRSYNSDLDKKVKELSKEPSTKPVNTNAKPSGASTYSAWREQMRNMIG
ncbi:MAG: XkdF-like putative serine protease domain-containing protein [Succinivibrio dextrinosolvens]|nr:XkdF-like putative serine protease domain-containing protein [Succinivibrio dextrinosolvens]